MVITTINNIKHERLKLKLTKTKLAKLIGISMPILIDLEKHKKRNPHETTINKIINYFQQINKNIQIFKTICVCIDENFDIKLSDDGINWVNKNLEYKGYKTEISFCETDLIYHGKILDIKDSISFEGGTTRGVLTNFEKAVDDYLEILKYGKE
jgi:predicted transcriptional regulator